MKSQLLAAVAALTIAVPAQAQYTAKEWPEGPMKQRFADTCGGCHDINRAPGRLHAGRLAHRRAHDAELRHAGSA